MCAKLQIIGPCDLQPKACLARGGIDGSQPIIICTTNYFVNNVSSFDHRIITIILGWTSTRKDEPRKVGVCQKQQNTLFQETNPKPHKNLSIGPSQTSLLNHIPSSHDI